MSRTHAESPGFAFDSFAWPSAVAFYAGWLRLGTLAVLLLPDARASHGLLGWMPFWLLIVPTLALLQRRLMRGGRLRSRAAADAPRHVAPNACPPQPINHAAQRVTQSN